MLLGAAALLGVVVAATPQASAAEKESDEKKQEIAPPEDLMREHGVLRRVLLVYGEAIRRLESRQEVPPVALQRSASIIRTFIEDYHERLEEEFLFPRFKKAGSNTELVDVLARQHEAGRRVTERITRIVRTDAFLRDAGQRDALVAALREFIRMYEPHAAREDTELFPSFRKTVSPTEFNQLGDQFEKREHDLFGEQGFERFVTQVADIEKMLGINALDQFTPKA